VNSAAHLGVGKVAERPRSDGRSLASRRNFVRLHALMRLEALV